MLELWSSARVSTASARRWASSCTRRDSDGVAAPARGAAHRALLEIHLAAAGAAVPLRAVVLALCRSGRRRVRHTAGAGARRVAAAPLQPVEPRRLRSRAPADALPYLRLNRLAPRRQHPAAAHRRAAPDPAVLPRHRGDRVGPRDHPPDVDDPHRSASADAEAVEVAALAAGAPTADQGAPGQIQGRQAAPESGDDEVLPG